MLTAEICFHNIHDGWKPFARIRFNNAKRFYRFVRYYSRKYPYLIRVYNGTWWNQSFLNGVDIWNDF